MRKYRGATLHQEAATHKIDSDPLALFEQHHRDRLLWHRGGLSSCAGHSRTLCQFLCAIANWEDVWDFYQIIAVLNNILDLKYSLPTQEIDIMIHHPLSTIHHSPPTLNV